VKAQIEDILKNMDSAASAGEASDEESSGGSADRVKMTVDARLGSLVVLGCIGRSCLYRKVNQSN
jgi:hypothetical protein